VSVAGDETAIGTARGSRMLSSLPFLSPLPSVIPISFPFALYAVTLRRFTFGDYPGSGSGTTPGGPRWRTRQAARRRTGQEPAMRFLANAVAMRLKERAGSISVKLSLTGATINVDGGQASYT